jgi:DNA-binding transcriptional MerR regulator
MAVTDDDSGDDELPADEGRSRPSGKSISAFRTISEVSADLDVPQHVLRFWETKFTQLRPLKRGGGRRYYRPEDVTLLRRIHTLLYREGYTIKGVQRVLRTTRKVEREAPPAEGLLPAIEPPADETAAQSSPDPGQSLLREVLAELKVLRALLD